MRVFSEGTPPNESDEERERRRVTGGEVDGVSRHHAHYIDRLAGIYFPTLDVMMVYRLDRFGRSGHHRPFADQGFPAVRLMEAHEHYQRQHQDVRVEDGIHYGDVVEGVDFAYAARITALDAATLAALAWAPPPPREVVVRGAVRPYASLTWSAPEPASDVAGYRVYWRLTDSPTRDHSAWVGNVTEHAFEGLVIEDYFFGVASVSAEGHESLVVFARPASP